MTPAVKVLDDADVDYVICEYERHLSGNGELRDFGREAAEALGLSTDEVFKTLVVVSEVGELAVAVLPTSCQLSMKAAAAALGVKRVAMCDQQAAERATGYVVGGISPLGQRRELPTVIDESVELFDMVYVSGGRRGLDLGLSAVDLIELTGASVAPITA